MKKIIKIVYLMTLIALGACKKDGNDVEDPTPTNDEELITTVTLHFTEKDNTSNHFMASFKDVDGAGGNDATIDSISLDTNTTYNVTIELLDESGDVIEDITVEVKEEGGEHIVCYESSTSNLTVAKTDSDGTYSIGLESDWFTRESSTGTVGVTIKHQPDGQKDGTCTPGETDVEVDFPLVIK